MMSFTEIHPTGRLASLHQRLVERDIKECAERLERYLLHLAVASGAAIQAARDDYRNVSKDRQMLAALPKAWRQIIDDEDELLLEILADRVETLCGLKPGPDLVASFLKDSVATRLALATSGGQVRQPSQAASRTFASVAPTTASSKPSG